MIAGDPIAVHWRDKKGAHVTRGLLVVFSSSAVMVSTSDGTRLYVWTEVSKVRKIT